MECQDCRIWQLGKKLMCSIPDLQQSTRLLQSQGMLSMGKALPPWKCLTAFPRLGSTWISAWAWISGSALPVLGALPFLIPSFQAPGISSEKKKWEFKPWGEFQVWLHNVLFQNSFSKTLHSPIPWNWDNYDHSKLRLEEILRSLRAAPAAWSVAHQNLHLF